MYIFNRPAFRLKVFLLITSLGLSGCVFTGAQSQYAEGYHIQDSAKKVNAGLIDVYEGDKVPLSSYKVIGTVEAYARSFNLLSSEPTRADVNEALRAEAAELGANAVIGVVYHSERTGLMSRGKLSGQGIAIQYEE